MTAGGGIEAGGLHLEAQDHYDDEEEKTNRSELVEKEHRDHRIIKRRDPLSTGEKKVVIGEGVTVKM